MDMNQRRGLMLTLGHNSSAVFYDGVTPPIGYEEERLNGIKGSSAFPILAIKEIVKRVGFKMFRSKVFVSHWYDSFSPEDWPERHWSQEAIDQLLDKYSMELVVLSKDFTHHDAHAWSAKSFFNEHHGDKPAEQLSYIVADGFGNKQEVISIYKGASNQEPVLVDRFFGYNKSLGLLYQHATSFVGMEENKDEYKFLGYESLIENLLNRDQVLFMKNLSQNWAESFIRDLLVDDGVDCSETYINVKALENVKKDRYSKFQSVINCLQHGSDVLSLNAQRAVIGYLVQKVSELTVQYLIQAYEMENVVLSGGCFYNVKTNNHALQYSPNLLCVIPLAGDQGAAIGMYEKWIGGFKFGDLCWGYRDLNVSDEDFYPLVELVDKLDANDNNRLVDSHYNYFIKDDPASFVRQVVHLLNRGKIVNIMHGKMEFGPRALCHTSTLALPTDQNVQYINKLNKRNTVMPMAPVILENKLERFLARGNLHEYVVGSDQFMIITHKVNSYTINNNLGVCHPFPHKDGFSARPQVIKNYDSIIANILALVNSDCLINTSFNTHGTPILYSSDDAIRDFMKQRELDDENRAYLVILNNAQ